MSAIALSWVASVQVGDAIAKSLLLFYASHNFSNEIESEFKVESLAYQLEISVSSVQKANRYLIAKGFIKRIPQYTANGTQRHTQTVLCIPQSFVDNWMGINKRPPIEKPVDKLGGEGVRGTPYPVRGTPSRVYGVHPSIVNKNNKELFICKDKNGDNFEKAKPATVKQAIEKLPRHLQPKRYKSELEKLPILVI